MRCGSLFVSYSRLLQNSASRPTDQSMLALAHTPRPMQSGPGRCVQTKRLDQKKSARAYPISFRLLHRMGVRGPSTAPSSERAAPPRQREARGRARRCDTHTASGFRRCDLTNIFIHPSQSQPDEVAHVWIDSCVCPENSRLSSLERSQSFLITLYLHSDLIVSNRRKTWRPSSYSS